MIFQFDEYLLDTEQKHVIGPDGPVSLRPQTFGVLCHLVEQAPSVVSRDELLDAVWGHQATSVSSVAQTIKELRRAFGDSSTAPRLIATRRRIGYQFTAPVEREAGVSPTGAESPAPDAPIASRERSGRSLRPWSSVLAAGATLLVLILWWTQPPPSNEPSDQVPKLAVTALVNAGGEPANDWLEPALALYLRHALVELAGFRVVPGNNLGDAANIGARPVDYLINGRYVTGESGGARLIADLRRPGSEDIVFSVETRNPDWNVADLSIDLAVAIRDTLGFSAPPDADSSAIRLRLPRVADAQKAYFAALDALGELEPARALEQILLARRSEPDHPRLDHLEALSLSLRGDVRAARLAAGRAMAATALWPRRDRLDLEATAAALDFDFERAADRLQSLNQFFPEPTTIRRMIEAQIDAGRLDAAENALAAQGKGLNDDPRLLLLAARLAEARRDQSARLESSQLALRRAGQAEQLRLRHRARLAEAEALASLGDQAAAAEILAELVENPETVNALHQAEALLQLARIHLTEGRLNQSLITAEQARDRFEAVPAPIGAAEATLLQAEVQDRAGRSSLAVAAVSEAVDRFDAIGDQRGLARAHLAFGVLLARTDRPEEALERLEGAAAAFRSLGDRHGEANALFETASTLARVSGIVDAEPVFKRALEAFIDVGDRHGRARALGTLADIAGERGNSSVAIRLAEEALDLFEQLDARTDIARVSFRLALLHRRLGELVAAERRLRQSAEASESARSGSIQARALTTLGQLLISMGRSNELGAIVETLDAVTMELPTERFRLHALIGEQALMTGRAEAARAEFQIAYDLLAESGSEQRLLDPRLDLARAALAQGQSIAAEEKGRELAVAFEQADQIHRQIDALMLLGEALIDQDRGDEAGNVLARADQRLSESPDAEQTLELALLRSRITDGDQADERLDWVVQAAGQQGFERLRQQAIAQQRRLLTDRNDP